MFGADDTHLQPRNGSGLESDYHVIRPWLTLSHQALWLTSYIEAFPGVTTQEEGDRMCDKVVQNGRALVRAHGHVQIHCMAQFTLWLTLYIEASPGAMIKEEGTHVQLDGANLKMASASSCHFLSARTGNEEPYSRHSRAETR